MEIFEPILLPIHIALGTISLIIFWIPVFTKWGADTHRKVGKWYVNIMWGVVATAAILSVENLVLGGYQAAAFLGFLTLITANPLWYGIAVLKNKKERSESYNKKHNIFNIVLLLTGISLIILGIYLGPDGGGILMVIFGILGITNASVIIKEYRNPPKESNWFLTHMEGMLTSGIASYTAFFAFGGRALFGNIFTGYWMTIPWIAPSVIGVIAIAVMKRKYGKK